VAAVRVAGAALVLFFCSLVIAGCRAPGDVRVTRVVFEGNQAIGDAALAGVMATRASGWLPWSPRQYFNQADFEADLDRLRTYYDDRGYPDARIAGVDLAFNDARDAVAVTITIDEGTPTVVDQVRVTGLDALPERWRARLAPPAIAVGEPRDRAVVEAERQRLADWLRDRGYAYGEAKATETAGAEPGHLVVTLAATPGPRTVFGPITLVGPHTVSDRVITRELSFRPGQMYRQSLVAQSERRLATLQILRFVHVEARPPEGTPVTAIPVQVVVSENPPRRLELGAGYGSEDRLRASAGWSHLNVFGNASQFEADGKWSSIDRGLRASFSQPYLYRRGLGLDASATSWWTHEETYDSRTYGGRLGATYRFARRRRRAARAPADVLSVAYVHEYLRYGIHEDALADIDNFDELIALGLDPVTGQGRGTNAAIAVDFTHDDVDSAADPTSGYGVSLHAEIARPGLGGTFRYSEYLGEARGYLPLGSDMVLAGRMRYGTLAAADDMSVPFSARYFLGGSTSLRGWGRYEVAPLSSGLPIGGRTIVDGSAELRVGIRRGMGVVGFFDAGNVFAGSWAGRGTLRSDAGVGLRYRTPVGVVRADLGVQINRVPGLIVNGEPEHRHWRLHLSIGQAF
jgi:outer membrane protein assembly complex protein YaeT